MTVEHFFRFYANMPMADRDQVVSFEKFGLTTWTGLYKYFKDLEEKMFPYRLERDRALRNVTNILIALDKLS